MDRQILKRGTSFPLTENMQADIDLEQLYDENVQALFAYLIVLTRKDADTRDILQEVFYKIAKNPAVLNGVRDRRSFLIRLAHNSAVDLMRQRQSRENRHNRFSAESSAIFEPSSEADEQTFREELSRALNDLPEDQRIVVHLKLWENLTFEAIAEILDISANTAASRYRYGLDKLRERLRPLYKECL